MPPLIKVGFDAFKEVEKRLKYKFWDKERERSNRAARLADGIHNRAIARCPSAHDRVAWSGQPHDSIRAWICLQCHAVACEPEIKDMGYDFDTVPDWIMDTVLDNDLVRQSERKITSYRQI